MKNKEGKTTANDNNKHSNMLDFWAIVLSVIALVVSCKIAENQNNINLFERRYLLPRSMELGCIQNVVVMEADLTMELWEWYMKAAKQFGTICPEVMK